jgi:hypothetical protein
VRQAVTASPVMTFAHWHQQQHQQQQGW